MQIINGRWEKDFRHYLPWLGGALLGLIVLGGIVFFISLHQITLKVDGAQYVWKTLKTNVKDVLAEKRIVLRQGDIVRPGLGAAVTQDLHIEVVRAFSVQITVDGGSRQIFTVAQPIRKLLSQAGIAVGAEDRISPGLDEIAQPDQQIRIVRISSAFLTTRAVLKPGTEYRKDNHLERGATKVIQNGAAGLVERRFKVVYADGKEIGRHRLIEKIVKPAVNAIIALGIKPVIRTLETTRGTYRYLEMKLMNATAYSPGPESCGKYAVYGRTYTGKRAGFGLVAVDPRVIPLGTQLYIDGYGKAEAADIGAAIKGNKIDLCFETYREAVMYGRRKIKVYILE